MIDKIKVLFVTATRGDLNTIYWYNIVKDYSPIIQSKIVECSILPYLNNTKGLSEVYNDALDKHRSEYDYIVFIHNDTVFVCLKQFLNELITTNSDVMGLAGAVKIESLRRSPCAWNVIAGKNQAGEVWHKIENTLVKNIYANTPSHPNVDTIDGVCIILNKNALNDENLKFDNRFTFDVYDLDFCFTAKKLLNHNIAIIRAPVIHYSVGKGVLENRYKEMEKLFREKWQVYISNESN